MCAYAPASLPRPDQARLKQIKSTYGSKVLGEVTVEQCIGGMRGIPVRGAGAAGGPIRKYAPGTRTAPA